MTFDLEEYRRGLRERRRNMPKYFVLRRSTRGVWLLRIVDRTNPYLNALQFRTWQDGCEWGVRVG